MRKYLRSILCLSLFCSNSFADTICRRTTLTSRTKPEITLAAGTARCPRGYKALGTLLTQANVRSLALAVMNENRASLIGPTGPKGDTTFVGPRGVIEPPISFTLAAQDASNVDCHEVNVKNICADGDGCILRLIIDNQTTDGVDAHEALFGIENPAVSPDSIPGLQTSIIEGGALSAGVIGSEVRSVLWGPIPDAVQLTNYRDKRCPGQLGVDGEPFIGPVEEYTLSFLAGGLYRVHVLIFDS